MIIENNFKLFLKYFIRRFQTHIYWNLSFNWSLALLKLRDFKEFSAHVGYFILLLFSYMDFSDSQHFKVKVNSTANIVNFLKYLIFINYEPLTYKHCTQWQIA